jgi:sporulation protein YlmC with PRC-barrel domain
MPVNQFEESRKALGTLARDAQHVGPAAREDVEESSAISRDDVRDGAMPHADPAEGSAVHLRSGNDPSGTGKHGENRPESARRVIGAEKLTGTRVRNSAGDDLGIVEEIMLDIPTGRVAYAVLSFGGFLGIGNKLFAVPWKALELDQEKHEFILDIDRDKIEHAPGFTKDAWPDMADPAFASAVHEHYGEAPYWEHDVTDSGDYIGDNRQSNRSIEYEPTQGYRKMP